MSKYTITDYAERVGVTRAYIYKLEKQNKIDFTVKGNKKYVESDQADIIVKFKPAERVTTKTAQNNGSKRSSKGNNISELSTLTKVDIALKAAKLEAQKLKNEKDSKMYYSKTEINDKSFDLFREIRDGVQSLKDRVALKCRAADSDHEARKILNDEVHNILNSIVEGYNLDDEAVKKKLLSLLI